MPRNFTIHNATKSFVWTLLLLCAVMYALGNLRELSRLRATSFQLSKGRDAAVHAENFITVDGLWLRDSKGKPYFLQGMNYWSCMNLGASEAAGGDIFRLRKELDQLVAVGVNHIRVMGATEGAENKQPFRILPALQPASGQVDERMFQGLDTCIVEASKRGIRLTVVMGNTWQWTGGNAQLYAWAEGIEEIPYPRSWNMSLPPQRNDQYVGWGNWTIDSGKFESFQEQFYTNEKAQAIYQAHLDKVMNRRNTITGRIYKEDATIMTWEPINEPQLSPDGRGGDAMIAWHNHIASHIKSNAPKQLITTGFEAKQGSDAYKELHKSVDIDYGCGESGGFQGKGCFAHTIERQSSSLIAHMWPQIWGKYDMLDPSKENLDRAIEWTSQYILEVESYSRELGKPILLEEFGMPRDNWMNDVGKGEYLYDTSASTTSRDAVFASIFELVSSRFKARGGLIGLAPWSYGGIYRSSTQQNNNQGILIAGDPPQEPPGWFSILDTDHAMELISKTHRNIESFLVTVD